MTAILMTILRTLGGMILSIILSPLMLKKAVFAIFGFIKDKLGAGSKADPVIDEAEKILDQAIPDDGSKPNLPSLPDSNKK